jgi:hypothetical protein
VGFFNVSAVSGKGAKAARMDCMNPQTIAKTQNKIAKKDVG